MENELAKARREQDHERLERALVRAGQLPSRHEALARLVRVLARRAGFVRVVDELLREAQRTSLWVRLNRQVQQGDIEYPGGDHDPRV